MRAMQLNAVDGNSLVTMVMIGRCALFQIGDACSTPACSTLDACAAAVCNSTCTGGECRFRFRLGVTSGGKGSKSVGEPWRPPVVALCL